MASVSDVTVKVKCDTSDFDRAVKRMRRDLGWLQFVTIHPRLVLLMWAILLVGSGFVLGVMV